MLNIFEIITATFAVACLFLAVGKFILWEYLDAFFDAIYIVLFWPFFILAPFIVFIVLPAVVRRIYSYLLLESGFRDLAACLTYILGRSRIVLHLLSDLSLSPTEAFTVVNPVESFQQRDHGNAMEFAFAILNFTYNTSRFLLSLLLCLLTPVAVVVDDNIRESLGKGGEAQDSSCDLSCTPSSVPLKHYVDSGTSPRRFIPMTKEEIAERDIPEDQKNVRIKELLGEVYLRDRMLSDSNNIIEELKQSLIVKSRDEFSNIRAMLSAAYKELDYTYAELTKLRRCQKYSEMALEALYLEQGRWAQDKLRLKLVRKSLAEERSAYNTAAENLEKEEANASKTKKDLKREEAKAAKAKEDLENEEVKLAKVKDDLEKEEEKVAKAKQDLGREEAKLARLRRVLSQRKPRPGFRQMLAKVTRANEDREKGEELVAQAMEVCEVEEVKTAKAKQDLEIAEAKVARLRTILSHRRPHLGLRRRLRASDPKYLSYLREN